MICPRGDGELRRVEIGPVYVDVCDSCNATWYDIGELRVLKDRESAGDFSWIHLDLWKDTAAFQAPEQRRLACPVDGTALTTMGYGDTGVSVDACEKCRGVFVDKDEYDRIIQHLEERVDSETLAGYLGDMREEVAHVFTGAEGPLTGFKHLDRILYLMQLRFGAEHPGIAAILRQLRV